MSSPTLIRAFVAGTGGVNQYRFVKFGAADGEVVQAAAADAVFGVSVQPGSTAAGSRADVALGGVAEVYAGANVTRGALLTSDANGAAITAAAAAGTNVRIAGVAMVSAASGDIIPILLNPCSFQG
ncbi:MAG: DUF2190 family protein [Alphaproteobacteria bacterium]|nr:DUF2190 family protein [Alphaproteobacteria bacterium]